MIELPKRSITRFFVPLIDVLILLFCIFLLMPYVAPPEASDGKPLLSVEDADKLRADLKAATEKAQELQAKLDRPEERYYWAYLEISPADGTLSTFVDGDRRALKTSGDAETIMRRVRLDAGKREPCYLMLFPRERSGYPEQKQVNDYRDWFKDANVQIDNPLKPAAAPAGSR